VAILVIFLRIFTNNMNYLETRLFSIGILTKALSNMTWFLFAVSTRSAVIAGIFILAATVLFLIRTYELKFTIKRYRSIHSLTSMSFLLFIPFIVYKIADMIYYISIYMLAF